MERADTKSLTMVHTHIQVDKRVWRKLRAYAIERGLKVNEALEEVLRRYFDTHRILSPANKTYKMSSR